MSQSIEQESPLSSARGKVSYATERVTKLALCVSEIADVVFGTEGPPAGVGSDQPPRMGEAGMLHDQLDSLSSTLDFLTLQINRLASLGVRPQESVGFTGAGSTASAVPMGRVRAY